MLVGRSHECDYPPGVEDVPTLTASRLDTQRSSRAIDAAARVALEDAVSIYEVDVDGLQAARPDVIVTQDLCAVCAVPLDDVRAAVARLAQRDVRLVNLGPLCLEHVWSDIRRAADGIGRRDVCSLLVGELTERIEAVAARARKLARTPKVLTIEWLDPVIVGGLWMPELVALAGGVPLAAKAGEHGRALAADELQRLDPDVVLVAPCGFSKERTQKEVDVLWATLPKTWRAVEEGRVYLADGSAFFNRPGPRLVESLEILAACIHPAAMRDLADKHHATFAPLHWPS